MEGGHSSWGMSLPCSPLLTENKSHLSISSYFLFGFGGQKAKFWPVAIWGTHPGSDHGQVALQGLMESSGSLPMPASFGRAEGWGISLRLCRIRPNRWLNFRTLGCDREWERGYPLQLPKISFTWRTPFSSLVLTSLNFHSAAAAAAAKSLQSYLTLSDPIDGSPPGFPVPGILQARTLEWVAISFSNA